MSLLKVTMCKIVHNFFWIVDSLINNADNFFYTSENILYELQIKLFIFRIQVH